MDCLICSVRRDRRYPAGARGGAVFAARRLRCGARLEVVADNSLHSLRSLRSDRIRQVRARSALRAPTSNLRSSPLHKSPLPSTACRSITTEVPAPHTITVAATACPGTRRRACETEPGHKQSSGLFVPGEEPGLCARRSLQGLRSGGFLAARFSALRALSCRILFERSERRERSELCDGPKTRAPQSSRSEAQTASPKRCRLPGRTFAEPNVAHCVHHAK